MKLDIEDLIIHFAKRNSENARTVLKSTEGKFYAIEIQEDLTVKLKETLILEG